MYVSSFYVFLTRTRRTKRQQSVSTGNEKTSTIIVSAIGAPISSYLDGHNGHHGHHGPLTVITVITVP